MKIETRTHFYNEIKSFCNEIGRLNLPSKFIKAAKGKHAEDKLLQVFEEFKHENPDLWEKMSEFYVIYPKVRNPHIFYGEYTEQGKEKGLFKYDPKEIDPINLIFLFVLGEGVIEDDDVFENYIDFVIEIEKVNPKLATFITESYLDNVSSLRRAFNWKKSLTQPRR